MNKQRMTPSYMCSRCCRAAKVPVPMMGVTSFNVCVVCLRCTAIYHGVCISKGLLRTTRMNITAKVRAAKLEEVPLFLGDSSPIICEAAEERLKVGK